MELSFLKTQTHHAVLLTHKDRKQLTNEVWEQLRNESIAHQLFDSTVLDIESARRIISWVKTSYDDNRIGLISFHTIGVPAQNALLKILEEPGEKTRLILITSNKASLIETILSRLHHHKCNDSIGESEEQASLFLATPQTQRMKLDFVTKLLTQTDEEGRKDREGVRSFILSLTQVLPSDKEYSRYITETLEIASYASDPSSSGKALLEYLSLLLPQVKD